LLSDNQLNFTVIVFCIFVAFFNKFQTGLSNSGIARKQLENLERYFSCDWGLRSCSRVFIFSFIRIRCQLGTDWCHTIVMSFQSFTAANKAALISIYLQTSAQAIQMTQDDRWITLGTWMTGVFIFQVSRVQIARSV